MQHIYAPTLKNIFFIFFVFLITTKSFAQVAEREPNNTFETADTIGKGTVKTGSVNNVGDQYDYFMAVLPIDGTLKIYVKGTNASGANGYLYFRGYDRRKGNGQVFEKYIPNNANLAPGNVVFDTLTVYGRAADTFYFRFEASQAFSYNLSYDIVDTSENDIEPNGTFEEALNINQLQEKKGHINYNGVSDPYDYYKTVLPKDGTLKIYVKGTNAGGANGYLYFRGYDRRKGNGQVFEKYIPNNANLAPGNVIFDTITVYGRAADTFYFRFEASQAFSYNLSYDIVDTSENDKEPNGTFEEALHINQLEEKKGHINYNGVSDQHDYYRTVVPVDGTLKIYVEGTNTSGTNGYLYFRGFDKRKGNGQVFETYIPNNANATPGKTVYDTISVYGVLADTFYFRFEASTAFKYKLQYVVVQNSELDAEPNNTFEQAVAINQGITKIGQVGYSSGGIRDDYDYYKTVLPKDGTLKIYVQGTNTGGANGYLYFRGYDRRKGNGQVFEKYIPSNANLAPGKTIVDSIIVYGRAADTFYFRFESSQAFSYSLRYDIVDTSENDIEPNGTFEEALNINQLEEKKGHINYNGVSDQFDYYKTVLPKDGTLKIYVKGTNASGTNGYLYFRGYDRRKGNGQVFEKYIPNNANLAPGNVVFDTITVYGRAADTFYFRFEASQAFSYSLRYDIVDTSENDKEPNGTFEEALNINQLEEKKGHISYNGVSDQFDYYKTVLPKDGTLKIYVKGTNASGAGGYMYFRGYDSRKNQVFEKYVPTNANLAPGNVVFDTLTVFGRAADTFYYRFEASVAFSYTLSFDVVDTSENDIEPNGTFEQALSINQLEKKKGHISYNGVPDQYDYYKTVLPKDGTLKVYVKGTNTGGGNGYLYFRVYDRRKGNGQVFGKYIPDNANLAPGNVVFDTITLYGRAADTAYFMLEASQAFSYTLSFDVVDTSENDIEPNNSFDALLPIKLNTSYKGHIGYANNGSTDANDYYKTILPSKGTVKIIVEITNTGGANGNTYLYGYDRRKASGQILAKYISNNSNVPAGITLRDTITLNCATTDTFYLRWTSVGSFKYTFRVEHIDRQPKADMTYERFGNTIGFRPQLSNADSLLWNFGDGTTSKLHYPVTTYKPGIYNAKLIAFGAVCNFKDTATRTFTITGIERFTPKKGGSGGDLNMQIFGGGLDTSARITLKKGSISIPAIEKYGNGAGSMIGMVFDLHYAQPGKYNLEVVFGNGDVITYDTAFTIESMIYPDTYSEIVGPAIWRTGRTANFNLVVGNNGNTIARGVIVALVWPKSAKLEFYGKQYSPNSSDFIDVELKEYNETIRSSYGLVKWIYDSLSTITPIDTFKTSAYDGYVQFLYVPVIAPNSTYQLPFKLTASASSKHKLITYTVKPNQYGSCETFNINSAFTGPAAVELMINSLDWAVDELKVPKTTKIPAQIAVKTLKVTQKHIDVSSEVASRRLWASYYNWQYGGGGENHGLTDSEYFDYYKEGLAADEFAKNQLQEIAIDQGINILQIKPGLRKNKLMDQIHDNNEALLNKANDYHKIAGRKTGRTKTWRIKKKGAAKEWKDQFEKGQKNLDELTSIENLAAIAEAAGRAKNAKGELEALIKYIEENCPEHKEALDKLKEELNKETDINKEKEKKTETSTSFDPNAIYGPTGFNQPGYVNSFDRQPFVIMFENVDTAKADAQIVTIKDTIDKTKFDLSTFELGNITIGGKWYKLPKSRNEVVMEINLSPDRNMRVRLNASLDTATGIATWQFTSIDPKTGDLPDFEGFLPPNKNYPAGEGSVTFSIYPHKNLPHGTILNSRASIVFDFNEPILTNSWINTIDAQKPTGQIQSHVTQDSIIVINYGATDAAAGVEYYNLYISEDNKEWVSIGGGNYTSQSFVGQPGKTYYFYVEAEDRVGNREEKSPVAETTITLKGCTSATPTITASGAITFCQGGSVVLSTTSTATLQWLKDGATISGATTQSYTATQDGSYTVRAGTGNCTATSAPIIVTVTTSATTPTITASGATTFCQGESVILSTTSTATLQWLKDGVAISGATSQSYTATQSGSYTVQAGTGNCTATSTAIVVTVTSTPATPTITTSGATTFCQGGSVVLTTTSTATLQWLKDGVAISGATSQSYTATQSGSYTVQAGTGNCTATSTAIVVIVTSTPATPTITTSGATTFCQGGNVVLSTTSTTTLQWLKDGTAISGATNQTYTVTQSGSYTVRAGTGNCTATSTAIVVTVTSTITPTVTASGATSFCQGSSVTLSSSATSANQWYKDGTAISGAVNQSYVATQTGNYTVITTVNNCSSSPSAPINIMVSGIPATPVINASGSTIVCQGSGVTLSSSSATGNQWYKDGVIITGATNQTYNANQTGNYAVKTLINNCSSLMSATININISPLPAKPVITVTADLLTSSSPTGNQWNLNGTPISGATAQQYLAAVTGQYSVTVNQNGCAKTSDNININPQPPNPFTLNDDVIVYPNPAKDKLIIKSNTNRKLSIKILNLLGVVVLDAGIFSTPIININITNLTNGYYVIEIIDTVSGGFVNKIFIKL